MKFGVYPTEGGTRFDATMEECRLAEEAGFDACWVQDHQVTEGDNQWPTPLLRLAAIATVADLEVVTGVLVLPLYHPLHVAQQAAMVDLMSSGRLTLGVGLGYVPAEFAAFDVSMDKRAGRMVEGLRLLDRFLSADEPSSFDSPYVSVDCWEPLPQTVREPRPPLWVGGWGEQQLQRSARLADAWVPGPLVDAEGVARRKVRQRAFVEQADKDWNAMAHPIARDVVVADTREEATELGRRYLHRAYVEEHGSDEWSHPLLSAKEVRNFETLAEDRFLVGTPDDVIAGIEAMRERFPVDHLGVRFQHAGLSHDRVMQQIELFGDEVIPAFD